MAASGFPSTTVVSDSELRGDGACQLGAGAFGVVWCVKSADESGRQFAAKKLSDLDTSSSARRVHNELCALTHLRHENILSVQGIVLLPTIDDFNEVYILSELMATDLRRVLASGQRLSTSQVQLFLYQILSALKYIHSLQVIHGDIKPENVLVNADCRLKLGDFGLVKKERRTSTNGDDATPDSMSRPASNGERSTAPAAAAVADLGGGGGVRGTISYAAPELLLGVRPTTTAVDMWATGCLLAEMITGRVLFHASTVAQQVDLMIELGVSACGVDEFTRAVHPAVGCYLRRRLSSRRGPASLAGKPSLCGLLSPDHNVQQLLPRLLVFSPKQRLGARLAMQHAEPGRRLYHSTLCRCCQHGGGSTATHAVDGLASSEAGLPAASDDRLHSGQHGVPPQLATESLRSLPQQQLYDIPLDCGDDSEGSETASVDILKDKIRKLCRQMDLSGSQDSVSVPRNSLNPVTPHCS